MLEAGAIIDEKDHSGSSAFQQALSNGQLVLWSEKNRSGLTALHMASERNHLGVVKSLLTAGAKVNEQCMYEHTALHKSVIYQDRIDVLVEKTRRC